MSDLGAPVSYLALPDGVPVFDRDGARVGVVDHILIDDVTGIFEGVIIHTRPVVPGRHLFASHEQIAEMRERGVRLAVDRDDLYELGQPRPRGRLDDRAAESAVETALRKAWDWITGVR